VTAQPSQLSERLTCIEQLVHAQQRRIAEQEEELSHLRATLAASAVMEPEALAAPSGSVTTTPKLEPKGAGLQTSRRALLMAGGTVAAVAAFEAVANHTPTAQAHGASASNASSASGASKAALGGVAWQTGTVLADEETLVKPSSANYSNNDMLQVQLGTGTVYAALSPALKAAITAYDTTTNNIGLYASSETGYGVYGQSSTGNGATGAGLGGTSAGGVGVAGVSNSGIAVSGTSTNGVGGSFTGGLAPIALGLYTAPGAPQGGPHIAGEIVGDSNAELWVCVASGSPGSWTKLAHLAPGATNGGAITYLSKPLRLLDTRPGQPAVNHPGAPYLAGSTHTITVAGATNGTVTVPATCVGAIGNLTVIGQTGGGNYVELVPSGAGFSSTSNLNFVAGQLVSNSYNVGLNPSGYLDIILGSGGNADVILDLYAIIA